MYSDTARKRLLATQKDMDAPVAVLDPRSANLLDPSFQAGQMPDLNT